MASLAKVRQGPDEPYSALVSRLSEAAERLLGSRETNSPFVKHLAFENANPACQDALHPHKPGDLSEYVRLWAGIGSSHTMRLAIGAALLGTGLINNQKPAIIANNLLISLENALLPELPPLQAWDYHLPLLYAHVAKEADIGLEIEDLKLRLKASPYPHNSRETSNGASLRPHSYRQTLGLLGLSPKQLLTP